MKIIAQTTSDRSYVKKYLVEMTDDELAQLNGFSSASSSSKLEIGAELGVTSVFMAMKNLAWQTNMNGSSLQSKAKELRELADSLDLLKVRMTSESEITESLQ